LRCRFAVSVVAHYRELFGADKCKFEVFARPLTFQAIRCKKQLILAKRPKKTGLQARFNQK
ncbi:hypothetical protein, partial [Pantoea endophytica]|uniref:hypothetical protein n=1 Tax=Pantoea endophytica TaxID=92488 RepID=UPI00289917A4